MQFVSNGFNTFKMNDSIHVQMLIIQKMWKFLTCSNINVRHWIFVYVSIYINKWNMQHFNNGFNKFKVDDSTRVKMLIVQNMWKKSLNHSSMIAKHWVACVSIYFNKCMMQHFNSGFNILKMNGLTNVHMLIIEEMWKKSLIHSNINGRS
jgi:hypothetical protein